jgi:hypothetical protein
MTRDEKLEWIAELWQNLLTSQIGASLGMTKGESAAK